MEEPDHAGGPRATTRICHWPSDTAEGAARGAFLRGYTSARRAQARGRGPNLAAVPRMPKALSRQLALFLLLAVGCEGSLAIESSSTERPGGGPSVTVDAGGGQGGGGVSILPDSDAGPDRDAGPGAPGCTPSCDGRSCGDDGCGGSCGQCAGGQSCSAGQCVGAPPTSPLCPPTGAVGRQPGDVAPDLSFPLAGGGTMSIRDTCANRTTLVYYFAEWCGYCRGWMRTAAAALQAELAGQGFQLVIYYAQNYSRGQPTEADAERIRAEYGLGSIPIGLGDQSSFLTTFYTAGPQIKILLEEGNVLAAPIQPMSDSAVRQVANR